MYHYTKKQKSTFFNKNRRSLIITLIDLLIILGIFYYVSTKNIYAPSITKKNLKFTLKKLNLKKSQQTLFIFQMKNISKETQTLPLPLCEFIIFSNHKIIQTNTKILEMRNQILVSNAKLAPDDLAYTEIIYHNLNSDYHTRVEYNYNGTLIKLGK